jgi:glycosyltransferase involved in cell wall biosynthesis
MKIVYISEYFPYLDEDDISGGAESRCFNIAKEMSKKHNLIVITSWRKGQTRKHMIGNIKVLRVGPHHPYTNEGAILSRFKFALAAYRIAKKIKSDIIEGYNYISYIPAYYAAKKTKAKAIKTYHEVWIGEWIKNKGIITGSFGYFWEKWVLNLKWDKIISVSKFTANRLIKNKIPKSKIDVVYNGINLKEYQKVKEKKYKEPTVCSISRLTPKKRVNDLIRAIHLVKKDIPDIKLIIVGKGEESTKLKFLTRKLGLEKNIEFTGFVKEYKDVMRILKKSHIFCLPSVLEGFGIVMAEAMASETPYVCSDIEVLREVTNNGKGGLIFKQKNPIDLAHNIKELLTNKKLYSQKIKEEKELIKRYDWEKITDKINKIYENESFIHN